MRWGGLPGYRWLISPLTNSGGVLALGCGHEVPITNGQPKRVPDKDGNLLRTGRNDRVLTLQPKRRNQIKASMAPISQFQFPRTFPLIRRGFAVLIVQHPWLDPCFPKLPRLHHPRSWRASCSPRLLVKDVVESCGLVSTRMDLWSPFPAVIVI